MFQNAFRLEEKLERQIIIADTVLYQAILTFVQQDLAGYVRGGWLLRKAWKHYSKLHKEISQLHEQIKARNSAEKLPEAEQEGELASSSSSPDSESQRKGSIKRSRESMDQIAAVGEMGDEVSSR